MEQAKPAPSVDEMDEMSLLDLALVLAENWRALIAIPVAAGLIALGIAFVVPPTYTAVSRILPPVQQQSTSAALAAQLGALAGLGTTAASIKSPADQYVALLKSNAVFDAIIKRYELREIYSTRYLEDARKELGKRVKITSGVKDSIIAIEVDDDNPKRAAEMANGFVEELRKLTKTLAITEAAQRRLFFEEQLKQAKNDLTKAEVALQASGVSEATLRTVPQTALEAVARLKAQITAHEIRLASMRIFMTDANPEFRLSTQELAALRTELSRVEQSSPAKTASKGAEYIAKYRDFKYHETLFELMARQYEFARLDEAREGAVIQVVDSATPPERRSGPRKALITALAALTSFLATLLLVLLRHRIRQAAIYPQTASKIVRLKQIVHIAGR